VSDIVLIYYAENPESYLVEQIPGMMLVRVGFEQDPQWVLLAVGSPLFSNEEEAGAQKMMRRYGLDALRFEATHQAATAIHRALEREKLA
jgi:hypothetical protein